MVWVDREMSARYKPILDQKENLLLSAKKFELRRKLDFSKKIMTTNAHSQGNTGVS